MSQRIISQDSLTSSTEAKPLAKKRLGFDIWDESPFMNLTIHKQRQRITVARGTILKTVNEEEALSDEVYETTISHVREVDEEEFVKIFTKNIRIMLDLSPAANKVFFVLLHEIQKTAIGTDLVFISWHRIEKRLEQIQDMTFSRKTFERGLKELLEKELLANAVEQSWFYINPAIVFNGDRVRFVQDYRKAKRGKIENKNQAKLPLDIDEEF